MGYNNNHAGMHMIWYHRRNYYEDLEYYDKLAEKKQKKKEMAKKVLEMEKEEKNVSVNPVPNIEQVKPQQTKKKKKKNQNTQMSSKVEKTKKEKIISDKYFNNTIDWYANIYLIAFERKLDIYNAICECEHLCEEDLRMQDGYRSFFEPVTVMDKTIVFLNLLADKMGCDVYEFILPNAEMRTRRVYRLLDQLEKQYGNSSSTVYAFEYSSEGEDDEENEFIIERLSLNQYMYLDIHTTGDDIPDCNMEYYFNKIIAKDGNPTTVYTFTVMIKENYTLEKKNQVFNFMFGGSDVISEQEGRLATFFENIKKNYLMNGGKKFDY